MNDFESYNTWKEKQQQELRNKRMKERKRKRTLQILFSCVLACIVLVSGTLSIIAMKQRIVLRIIIIVFVVYYSAAKIIKNSQSTK